MSILAQRHKQPVSHATTAFGATTFQPDGALVTLLQVETNFDSHSFVTLRVLQPPSTAWETGSPRPSDNLLLQRTFAGYFLQTVGLFLSLHVYHHRMLKLTFYQYEILNMPIMGCHSWIVTERWDTAGVLSKFTLKVSILLSNLCHTGQKI